MAIPFLHVKYYTKRVVICKIANPKLVKIPIFGYCSMNLLYYLYLGFS